MPAQPDQIDIFAAYAAPRAHPQPAPAVHQASRPDLDALMPSRPRRWMELLARATCTAIRIEVSTYWSGSVVEVLSDPELGRHHLHCNDVIAPVAASGVYGRQVWQTPETAKALHRRRTLVLDAQRDAWSATFRFWEAGEEAGPDPVAVIDGLSWPSPLATPRFLGMASHG